MARNFSALARVGFANPRDFRSYVTLGVFNGQGGGIPTAPTGLKVLHRGTVDLTISWDFQLDVTGFMLNVNGGADIPVIPAGLSFTLTGLTPATNYSITVKAFNTRGTSTPSAPLPTSTMSVVTPDPSVSEIPEDMESAFYRGAWDERVEMKGLPCLIYRWKDIAPTAREYDAFDDRIVVRPGELPVPIESWVILEPYQEERDRVGESVGTEIESLPFVASMRFVDEIRKDDLVEINYEYAQSSGRTPAFGGTKNQPTTDIPTRFKIVNRRTTGVRSDLTNKFYISPTEESWQ